MTVASTIPSQPVSATDNNVDLWMLDRTKWVPAGPVRTEGRNRIQDYTFDDGDARYPLRAQVRQTIDAPTSPRPMARNTVVLYPTVKKSDDVAETDIAAGECEFGMFYNVPADNSISSDDIYKWLTATLGAYLKTVTSGVGDKTSFNSLARRSLSIL